MLNSFEQIPNLLGDIKLPTIVQMSSNDPIVSSDAITKYFPKLGSTNKKHHIYKNNKHEIFNDIERDSVFKDFFAFVDSLL